MAFYFTSITMNYFAKARVLCKSLKKYNPEAKFLVAISDEIPKTIKQEEEPFDYVLCTKELASIKNVDAFFFKHTITELCTAVKPLTAKYIMDTYGAQKVIYLDPDIGVFDKLEELESFLDNNSIVLTPHQLEPEENDIYVRENEILFLKRGTYNFGFFGVKNDDEGRRFLTWWGKRLYDYCFDDDYSLYDELKKDGLIGMFTDQKWIDLVPSFFERYHIIREPGYNVCTWNMSRRHIEKKENKYFVNGKPLYFFHFSGYDSGGHRNELKKSLLYYPHNVDVYYLTEWYDNQLYENGEAKIATIEFAYGKYSNGETISDKDRKLFHLRKDIHHLFMKPYEIDDGFCFYNWVRENYEKYYVETDLNSKEAEKMRFFNGKAFLLFFPYHSKRRELIKKIMRK